MCFLAGESHWEISLAQAHGVSHGPGTEINSIVSLFCCLENSDQKLQPLKSCECWVHLQLWSVELTWIPRSGTILGSPGLTPAVFLQPFLCPISLCFSLDSSGCFFMPRHSPSLGVHVPLSPQEAAVPVCGERAWGALLSPLSPDSVHHLAWGKIVILFFINLFVPQSLIWEKKKKKRGMDPVVESNLGALHAAWCYTFLDIYVFGCQCFHSHPAATPGRWKQCSNLC